MPCEEVCAAEIPDVLNDNSGLGRPGHAHTVRGYNESLDSGMSKIHHLEHGLLSDVPKDDFPTE